MVPQFCFEGCQASTHHQAWIGTWGHRLADSCALAAGLHQPGGVPWLTENAPPPPPPPPPYTLNHCNLGTRSLDPITKVLRIPSRGTAPKQTSPLSLCPCSKLKNLPPLWTAAMAAKPPNLCSSLVHNASSERIAALSHPVATPPVSCCYWWTHAARKEVHIGIFTHKSHKEAMSPNPIVGCPAYLSKAHSSHQQGHEDQHQGNLSFVSKQLRASWGSLASL